MWNHRRPWTTKGIFREKQTNKKSPPQFWKDSQHRFQARGSGHALYSSAHHLAYCLHLPHLEMTEYLCTVQTNGIDTIAQWQQNIDY